MNNNNNNKLIKLLLIDDIKYLIYSFIIDINNNNNDSFYKQYVRKKKYNKNLLINEIDLLNLSLTNKYFYKSNLIRNINSDFNKYPIINSNYFPIMIILHKPYYFNKNYCNNNILNPGYKINNDLINNLKNINIKKIIFKPLFNCYCTLDINLIHLLKNCLIELKFISIDKIINIKQLNNLYNLNNLSLANNLNIRKLKFIKDLNKLENLNISNCNQINFILEEKDNNINDNSNINIIKENIINKNDENIINKNDENILIEKSILNNYKNILNLNLSHTKINNLNLISNLINLKKLNLFHCKNIQNFNILNKLTNLTFLNLGSTYFNDFNKISNLINLKHLLLIKCIPTYHNNIKILKNLKNLETFKFHANLIEFENINYIINFINIKKLSISLLSSYQNYKPLNINKLKNLNYLNLSFTSTLNNFSIINNLINLIELNLNGITLLNNDYDLNNLINLKILNISAMVIDFNFDLKLIKNCKNLEKFYSVDTTISNIKILYIYKKLTHLYIFSNYENQIDDIKFKRI